MNDFSESHIWQDFSELCFSLVESNNFDQNEIYGVNKYSFKFEPEIPENSKKLRSEILKLAREQIQQKIDYFIHWSSCIYSIKKVTNLNIFETEHDGA